MKFLILIACLILQVIINLRLSTKHYAIIDQYAAGMKRVLIQLKMDSGIKAILGLLLPVLLIILILNALFSSYGLLKFIYGTVILMLCLDIADTKKQLSGYFSSLSAQNLVTAKLEAENFVGYSVAPDQPGVVRGVTEAIFTHALTQIFSVLFWFILLGTFGAVLYALTVAIARRSRQSEVDYSDIYSVAENIKELLDWLPARFMTLTFALMGHFSPVISVWIDRVGGGIFESEQLVIDTGLTAINAKLDRTEATVQENYNALSLINRTLWTWVAVMAVITMVSVL